MASLKISFILTTYNFGKYIAGAINSLLQQRGNYDFEIIVVDDCSTDNTPEIVRQIKDDRIRYVRHEKNRGVAPSINEAFYLTRGEYICRFDGDDEWYPWFLEETVSVLDNQPEVGIVYGDISAMNSKGEITLERSETPDLTCLDKKALLKSCMLSFRLPAPAIIARRAAWEKAFPLADDLIFCDFDLALKMLPHFDLAFIDKPLAKYRVHEGNIHTTSFAQQRRGEHSILKSIQAFFNTSGLLSERDYQEILSRFYLKFADKYFAFGMMEDARRCYRKGFRVEKIMRQTPFIRRYLASYISLDAYGKMKDFYKKMARAAQ
jgi:glycosyltransferase involved in cell wall biosynthesis